jgi:putative flippase GtrA
MTLRREVARYGLVGLANTAIGYGLVLVGLKVGLGDYRANVLGYAAGLCFSFFANRRFTFGQRGAVRTPEIIRFLSCFAVSYAANLGVVALGRAWGYAEHPLLHLTAMALYSLIFFACMRSFAFRQKAV